MNIFGHDIGVCGWSLGHPTPPVDRMIELLAGLGLSHLQVGLGRLIPMSQAERAEYFSHFARARIVLTAGGLAFPGEDYGSLEALRATGGFVPDDRAAERVELATRAGHIAAGAGIKVLTVHAGFVPAPDDAAAAATYKKVVQRIADVATALLPVGVTLALETGQESPETLLRLISDVDRSNVGVNFDAANMILYGTSDPIHAIRVLGRHVRHVHVKDAVHSDEPGRVWGRMVPFGQGEVGPARFVTALKLSGYTGPLVIETGWGGEAPENVRGCIEVLRGIPG